MKPKDIFGKALLDYYNNHYKVKKSNNNFENIITWTNISDKDILPLPYLFRSYDEMPKIEKQALIHCKGKILDVGCGAGNHSLYLQDKGFVLNAIDISKGAVEVTKQRGVNKVKLKHVLEINEQFDTILLLMNGTGIFEDLSQVNIYLSHLKSLLQPNGQILIDSSDIKYMYDKKDLDELKSQSIYYGELDYFLSYKDEEEYPMTWLYLDFKLLKTYAKANGLKCEIVQQGEHFDYLVRLTK